MNCDSKLKDSLGKYVRGLLSKSDAEQVRKHLESCSECASQVAQIKLLLPAMEKMVKNHIPVDLLVDYHHLAKSDFSKKELLEWKLEQIEEHLLICDQCQSEIEILQNLE